MLFMHTECQRGSDVESTEGLYELTLIKVVPGVEEDSDPVGLKDWLV